MNLPQPSIDNRIAFLLLFNGLSETIQVVMNSKCIVQRGREVPSHCTMPALASHWILQQESSHDCGLPLGFQSPSSFAMMLGVGVLLRSLLRNGELSEAEGIQVDSSTRREKIEGSYIR